MGTGRLRGRHRMSTRHAVVGGGVEGEEGDLERNRNRNRNRTATATATETATAPKPPPILFGRRS